MNRIKQLREQKNIKQIDFAKLLNVSQGTLSNWEREIHDPDNIMLSRLSEYFNVSIDYLLCKTDDPAPPNKKKLADEETDEEILNNISFAYYGEKKKLTKKDEKDLIELVKIARQLRKLKNDDETGND